MGGDGVCHNILNAVNVEALLGDPVIVRHDGDEDLGVVGEVGPGPGLGDHGDHQGQGETDHGPHLELYHETEQSSLLQLLRRKWNSKYLYLCS